MEYKDKTVIVTGANRGIGSAIALYFHEQGANVVFAVRDIKSLDLSKEITTSARTLILCE